MAYVSVLVPAFYHNDPSQDMIKICSDFFGLETSIDNFELYELVPLKITKNMNLKNKEIAMKMPKTELNLKYIETIMEENAQLKIQVDKCKDAIKILTSEYSKLSSTQNASSQSSNLLVEGDPKLNKKLKKLKQMEEDNKRLRQLLKAQLENSEKMRLETQNTVETLKGEFDLLVKELTNVHKKDDSIKSNQTSSLTISENKSKDKEMSKSSGDIHYQEEDLQKK